MDILDVTNFVLFIILPLVGLWLSISYYRKNQPHNWVNFFKAVWLIALVSQIYIWLIDMFIIKRVLFTKQCYDWCGIENIYLSVIYTGVFIVALIIFGIGKFLTRNSSSDQEELLTPPK
jgi:hypothetical protein